MDFVENPDARRSQGLSDRTLELLMRHDGAAPRYTSYPPANFFTEDPSSIYESLIADSNHQVTREISLYFHIPFCPRRCLFCGCHTETDRTGAYIRSYMETLSKEFELLSSRLDKTRPVTQIHFGGGTPNAVPYRALRDLLTQIRETLSVAKNAEIALECDPSLVLEPQLASLREIGFNRISFGIQDVHPAVLEAVNRKPSRLPPLELVRTARELGFTGINLDLICGLPLQTRESFQESVRTIIDAHPDRISLFPYAHVPWIKEHQTALEALPSPTALDRVQMILDARKALTAAGYEAIGMDHYARPEDELAQAKRDGTLRRNFQGYVTSRAGQVYAMGASAISQLSNGYLQNEKNLDVYTQRVEAGELPFAGGYQMRPEDLATRNIINALLCHGRAYLPALLDQPELDTVWKENYLEESRDRLTPYFEDGLVGELDGMVYITDAGFPLSRRIAAAFDPRQVKAKTEGARYSRIL